MFSICNIITVFQSTLPRGERHRRATQNVPPQEISIHAPARGATICLIDSQLKEMISIHAPARGATSSSSYCKQSSSNFNPRSREGSDFHWTPFASSISYFNPRSREGSDGNHNENSDSAVQISIHAPARGATC